MGWLSRWFSATGNGSEEQVNSADLDRALELVIEHTDPRLRYLPGHQRRLRKPLLRTLGYLAEVVELIPGPLEMGRRQYGSDARVNALFGSVEQMLDLFGRSELVREYLRARPGGDDFYCSIGMFREEKRVLGMALKEEMVQKEVIQIAVNFTGHWIGVVNDGDRSVREALRWRGLESLCISALERIAALRTGGDRRLLEERLKGVLDAGCGLEPCRMQGDREKVRQRLAENARKLSSSEVPGGTLEDYLNELVSVLSSPEEHLQVSCHSVRVDRMGIRKDGEEGTEVTTAHVERPGQPGLELILARFPRDELRDRDYYRSRARSYVNAL